MYMKINPIYLKDFYKVGHKDQYPEGTSLIFSNFTPRKSRMPGVNHSVFFGLRYFLKEYLENQFYSKFFTFHSAEDTHQYNLFMQKTLGSDHDYGHINDLHELGHLPLAIYALPEGSVVPSGVPALVMHNTHPDYFWLPNMLETLMSCTLWGACTSATIAREYRILLDKFAAETSDMPEFVDYQAHDFSFRGMSSVESACISGMAHLQYFKGTDTIPALLFNKEYYGNDYHIASVPATEHSVMSAGGKEDELETFKRLLKIYPTGILSVVSDTWDLWNVLTNTLPALRDDILLRDGKLVIRPDSGNPVDILCGISVPEFDTLANAESWAKDNCRDEAGNDCEGSHNYGKEEYSRMVKVGCNHYEIFIQFEYDRHAKTYYYIYEYKHARTLKIELKPEQKGVIELLSETFGVTINSKGYKQLDSHIGVIYGDSITLDRAQRICELLKEKGYASTNIVFGVGSFTYQYNTRDTLGWAMKATYAEINGIGRAITKDPITDDGTKKSHSGLLKVIRVQGAHGSTYEVKQNCTWEEFNAPDNELKCVYRDGVIM